MINSASPRLCGGLFYRRGAKALIFSSQAVGSFHSEFLMMALVMAAVEVAIILLAMLILGPLIAMCCGDSRVVRKDLSRSLAGFFVSV